MAHERKRNKKDRGASEHRRYRVRGVRRDPVDIRKLSKALIGLVMAESERDAQAEHAGRSVTDIRSEEAVHRKAGPGGARDA